MLTHPSLLLKVLLVAVCRVYYGVSAHEPSFFLRQEVGIHTLAKICLSLEFYRINIDHAISELLILDKNMPLSPLCDTRAMPSLRLSFYKAFFLLFAWVSGRGLHLFHYLNSPFALCGKLLHMSFILKNFW